MLQCSIGENKGTGWACQQYFCAVHNQRGVVLPVPAGLTIPERSRALQRVP